MARESVSYHAVEPVQPHVAAGTLRTSLWESLRPQIGTAAPAETAVTLPVARAAATTTAFSLKNFLAESSPARALRAWFGAGVPADREQILHRLSHDLATIDLLLCDQVNVIIHHARFQSLEASWRGL